MSLAKPLKPIAVTAHDYRVHPAPDARRRELMEGRLRTLCGRIARNALPGISTAQEGFRCPVCYAPIDDYGYLRDDARG